MSNAMSALISAVTKAKQSGGKERAADDEFYFPIRDTAGNGSAVIRFLPATTDKEAPFVKTYSHGFKGPTGKWLIDECVSTLGDRCVICEENSKLYEKHTREDARKFGMNRKVHYITRILVIEDKKNPSLEGKVMLYRFGQKIFDKILDKLQPEFEDDSKLNVFGLEGSTDNWTNFKLKIRKLDGNVNYDKSEFEDSSDDVTVDYRKQFNAENEIQKFLDPKKFKTTEELKKRFDFVMGNSTSVRAKVEDSDEEFESPKTEVKTESKRVVEKKSKVSDDEDEDLMALMKQMTKED